jgi:mono/diheme cytochrome c family protein
MLAAAPRIIKWVGLFVLAGACVLAAFVWRTWDRTWDAPLPDLHATADTALIARGEYLVFGPAHCVECHSASGEAFERFAETGKQPPLVGGQRFAAAPLGTIYSQNLTPDPETGIGRYSDPQIARMLRYAVRPNGRASVRPLMQYADMSDADVVAVLSFLRSQKPVHNAVPPNEWSLIGKVVKSLAPTFKPRTEVHATATAPPEEPTPARGEYLARTVGNCSGCHSPLDQLTFALNGPEFSGGAPIEPRTLPTFDQSIWFRPPNLTPHVGSALLRFPDRDTWIARFQHGGRKYPSSPMPWDCFSRLTAEDAGALYEFFRTLPPSGEPSPEDPKINVNE